MTTQSQNVFTPATYFPTTLYTISRPDFLTTVAPVAEEYLAEAKKTQPTNEVYPATMSAGMGADTRIADFLSFVAQSGWTILDNQGYNVQNYAAYISEIWCQEHPKYSSMEQHTHPFGVLLSGFYFLSVPDASCMIQIYDPRAGKVMSSLPEKDNTIITEASNSMYIRPEAGMMVISNSWLPHSFTRNAAAESCKFIHFNISIQKFEPTQPVVV